MDDIDELVDLGALINVLLPLDLYKQTPFSSEQSFDRLRQLIHAHFLPCSVTTPPRITQDFLFSICNILWNDTQSLIPREKILPSVLRRIKLWRLLPEDEKNSDDAVERLVSDLARLVNCRAFVEADTSHNSIKRLRVRWIGSDSEYADVHCSTPSNGERTPGSPGVYPPNSISAQSGSSDSAHVCLNILHLHETAAFRSGCCCCRQPRTSVSTGRASLASLLNVRNGSKETPISPSLKFFSSIPQDTPKTNSKVVDENVPPTLSSAPHPIAKRSSAAGFKSRAISPSTPASNVILSRSNPPRLSAINANTASRLSMSHTQMISRSSRSHTSSSHTQACPSTSNTRRPPLPVRSSSSSVSKSNVQIPTPIPSSSSVISARTHKPTKSIIKVTSGSRAPASSTSQVRIRTSKQMLVEHVGDDKKTNNKMTAPSSRSNPIIPVSSRALRPCRGQV